MRGEYGVGRMVGKIYPELPPRARRIPWFQRHSPMIEGTTSACAENTMRGPQQPWQGGNYLRVREEYLARPFVAVEYGELPPRARRILSPTGMVTPNRGTTSACAENTLETSVLLNLVGNYLRVRGEYSVMPAGILILIELPPRARRIHAAY